MKIYVTGKMERNARCRDKFERAAQLLEAEGNVVFSLSIMPAVMSRADDMRMCFEMIDIADKVVFLPDFIDSERAVLEMQYCRYIGKETEIAGTMTKKFLLGFE